MEDIDVQFKWFAKIHSVMGGTVVVNLPEVLDTLDHNGQCSSSAIPDTKGKQGEQVQHPSSLLSGEQELSTQSGGNTSPLTGMSSPPLPRMQRCLDLQAREWRAAVAFSHTKWQPSMDLKNCQQGPICYCWVIGIE